MSDKRAAIKKDQIKSRLEKAYSAYLNKEPGSEDALLLAVRKLAYVKVYHLEHDFKDFGSAETADDWAQDVCLNVWKHLKQFRGTPSQFYSWVHKIAFNRGIEAFNDLKKENEVKAPLYVESKGRDGDNPEFEKENPEMYRSGGFDGFGIGIPASVQGTDRAICKLIIDGFSYKGVANELNTSVKAVTQRLYRLRNRLNKERAESPGLQTAKRVTRRSKSSEEVIA